MQEDKRQGCDLGVGAKAALQKQSYLCTGIGRRKRDFIQEDEVKDRGEIAMADMVRWRR